MKIPLIFRVFNSPFKTPKLHFYFGKIAIGTPIFYPRKWIKLTGAEAVERAVKSLNNPNFVQRTFEEWVEYHKNHQKAVPKKVGFDFCDFYWKTKWSNKDYRFEYPAVFSIVFFKWQFAITFKVKNPDHYFECFLYYYFQTDKNKTVKERIEQARKEFPQVWTLHSKDGEEKINYWDVVLKDVYNKQVNKG